MSVQDREIPIHQLARSLSAEEFARGLRPETLADCRLRTLVFSLYRPPPAKKRVKEKE